MNKKLKRLVVLGAVTIMTASNVAFSNALQVKKVDTGRVKGKIYICVNGKKYKFDINSLCIVKPSKPSIKDDCTDKIPSSEEDSNNKEDIDNNQTEDTNNDQTNENNNLNTDNNNQNNSQENNTEDDNLPNNGENQNDDNNSNDTINSDFTKEQLEVLEIVNKERKANGLKPLTLNKELSNVATVKSQDMINKGYFDHTSPTYGSPFDMMKSFGISYKAAGENIAKDQKTPSEVMNSWMNSPGHRANILSPNFTELGVGVAKDSKGTIYWTQMFIGK
ncbi:MAG: CAP domain-containing protein [Intestinibacter sp.]|uniref:CAP domain-containing protein n=1 Tax=Intestinibacter sp. TaxID=1965304 RepID=UPI0025C447AB|nr:CAP domain-containing protein [Intestinibacter sp.]MCI6736528.1 CAP domain-containing protein [Intestinibacter sp.]